MGFWPRFWVLWFVTNALVFVVENAFVSQGGSPIAYILTPLGSAILVLGLMKWTDFAGGKFAAIRHREGGEAPYLFSMETAMAKRGEREEACALLEQRWIEKEDPVALETMLNIAIKPPAMAARAAFACQNLLKKEGLHPDTREHYEKLLAGLGSAGRV